MTYVCHNVIYDIYCNAMPGTNRLIVFTQLKDPFLPAGLFVVTFYCQTSCCPVPPPGPQDDSRQIISSHIPTVSPAPP